MTTSQGGYASCNHFTGLCTVDDILDDVTAKTIAGMLTLHMANLLAQMAASIKANAMQINVSLQQLASNNVQLHQQQQLLMQRMAMLTTNATTTRNNTYAPTNATIYAPLPLQSFQQQPSYPPKVGGHSGGWSCGGCTCQEHGGGGRGNPMPPPVPYVGGAGIIPYIPASVQPPTQQPATHFSYIVTVFANQNVCFLSRFDVKDWHTIATCNCRKAGHQYGFSCSNYMEYAPANNPFCQKAMHKTMYASSF